MTEPFPLLSTSVEQLHSVDASHAHKRRPRKSSAFGSDIRAGDTGAPALASSRASLNAVDANGQVGTHTNPIHCAPLQA
jgi:very-long-chain ceramide synthase